MPTQLQIAPTLAEFFGVRLSPKPRARPIEQILKYFRSHDHDPQVLGFVVIDSLDSQFYSAFADELKTIHGLAEQDERDERDERGGLLLECETVSSHTTPAIASILTGLPPEAHGILTSKDVGKSGVRSVLEVLEDAGKPTAVVIETKGAEPLWNKISSVFAVDDREDILEYDDLITKHTVSALKKHAERRGKELSVVFSHLRAIDRFAHRGWDLSVAARAVDENVREIANAVSERAGGAGGGEAGGGEAGGGGGLLLLCGDHEAHLKSRRSRSGSKEKATVPLIVY